MPFNVILALPKEPEPDLTKNLTSLTMNLFNTNLSRMPKILLYFYFILFFFILQTLVSSKLKSLLYLYFVAIK